MSTRKRQKAARHREEDRYIVSVLWVIGFSIGSIARVTGLRQKQIAGIINRGEYANRTAMSDAERTERLRELYQVREIGGKPLDGGLIDEIGWQIMPLRPQQKRGGGR